MTGMRKVESSTGRGRSTRHSNKLEHLYKVSKCRECSVDVIRMDFKKMMGEFTKVKIQYDNNDAISSPARSRVRTRKSSEPQDINVATRLRSNENGMVLIHRKAYQKHPVKSVTNKDKKNETKITHNVLKERNSQLSKKALEMLAKSKKSINLNGAHPSPRRMLKQYYLAFTQPAGIKNFICNTKPEVFKDILLQINKTILPNNDWAVVFSPTQKNEQDVVYDRIAAELEGLMPSDKSPVKDDTKSSTVLDAHSKPPEDFPSIMDILNEEPMSVDPDKPPSKPEEEPRTNDLQASDIEAMLTGSSDSDTTSTLTADSTNADGGIRISPKKSANSEINMETRVIENKNKTPTNKIMNKKSEPDSDPGDTDSVIKEETESVKQNLSKDEEMELGINKKESDILAKNIAEETKDVSAAVSESMSLNETDNSVKEEDANDEKRDIEPTSKQDGAVSNNFEQPAVNEELGTATTVATVESKKIGKMQKNEKISENTCSKIDSKHKVNNNIPNDSAELLENEDMKMDTNDMDLEDDGVDKGDSNVEHITATDADMKDSETKIVQQEELTSIIPEYYNSELVTHISFKHLSDTKNSKSKTVIFHKSFDYDIEIEGKKVQLLGAPKSINDIEDLKVLLQIVNETGLNSFNILH